MANPAVKNGYFPIANELAEQFALKNIPGNEMRVLWVVLRKTWGWSKSCDRIPFSQFVALTGMKHGNVSKSIKSLVVKRLLTQDSESRYSLNQDYNQWLVVKRLPTKKKVVKRLPKGSQKHTKQVVKSILSKDNKDTTKTIAATAAPAKKIIPPFSMEETRDKWYGNDDKEDFQLLAWFFDKKGLWKKFNTRAKVEAAVTRHIRPARRIVNAGWSQKECEKALVRIIEGNPKMRDEYTLETLEKYLTK
jgi:phage replication O-like protein O